MDPATLATAAVAAVTPLWTAGATEVAKAAAKGLYDWLKGKLTGSGAEALADLENAPSGADNQAALRVQLNKLLKANPALASELQALVPKDTGGTVTQIINQTGSTGAKAAQADRGSTATVS